MLATVSILSEETALSPFTRFTSRSLPHTTPGIKVSIGTVPAPPSQPSPSHQGQKVKSLKSIPSTYSPPALRSYAQGRGSPFNCCFLYLKGALLHFSALLLSTSSIVYSQLPLTTKPDYNRSQRAVASVDFILQLKQMEIKLECLLKPHLSIINPLMARTSWQVQTFTAHFYTLRITQLVLTRLVIDSSYLQSDCD